MGGIKDKYKTLAPSLNSVNGEYFRWLCELVGLHDHLFMATDLFKKEFIWSVPNDENRAADGKMLRERFADEMVYFLADKNEYPCSVLEMIIGVSQRLEDQTDIEMYEWFWTILDHLGLNYRNDSCYYDHGGPVEVDIILDKLLKRGYRRDGLGSMFPLLHTKQDMRVTEIWYQMNYYLGENYEI